VRNQIALKGSRRRLPLSLWRTDPVRRAKTERLDDAAETVARLSWPASYSTASMMRTSRSAAEPSASKASR
jgi:hypothetical protein